MVSDVSIADDDDTISTHRADQRAIDAPQHTTPTHAPISKPTQPMHSALLRSTAMVSAGAKSQQQQPLLLHYQDEPPQEGLDGRCSSGPATADPGCARCAGWRRELLGFGVLLLVGAVMGLALPKNPKLTDPVVAAASNILGWTYFLAWTVSFYPQVRPVLLSPSGRSDGRLDGYLLVDSFHPPAIHHT